MRLPPVAAAFALIVASIVVASCDIGYNRGVDLMSAVKAGDLERAERLVDAGADLDLIDNNDLTVLDVAREKGYKELVELMEVTSLDQIDATGHTPVMRAIEAGETQTAVGMMERRIDITVKDAAGRTAWDYAVEFGDSEVVRVALITHTEDITQRMLNEGLYSAVWQGIPKMVETLLDHGANPRRIHGPAWGGFEINVVQAAFSGPIGSNERYFDFRRDLVFKLVEAGGSPDGRGKYTVPPLVIAINYRDLEMVQFLIDNGANVNASFKETTVLNYAIGAVSRADDESAELAPLLTTLIEAGARIERRSELGYTPLIEAARLDVAPAVETLIDAGAKLNPKVDYYNPEARTWMKMTALEIAETNNLESVVEILRTASRRIR